MESPIETPQAQPKSNRNIIIAVVVAVILCCCCVATAVAGYYGYQAYIAAQSTIDQLENIEIPTSIPLDPNDPSIPIPGLDGNDAPQGGLADDSTRIVAWSAVQLVALISDCTTPTAQGTTITVLQEPDTNGEWVEEWNVSCGEGSSQPYKVTFTPENGIVNVNVELP